MVSDAGAVTGVVQQWLVHSTKFVVSGSCAAVVLYSSSWVPFFHMLGACINGAIANIAKAVIKQPRPFPYAKEGYGMPSSHSQSIFYFVMALWCEALSLKIFDPQHSSLLLGLVLLSLYLIAARYAFRRRQLLTPGSPLFMLIFLRSLALMIFMARSFVRAVTGYHTFRQVAVGCVAGLAFGFLGFHVIRREAIHATIEDMGAPPLWIKLLLISAAAVGLYGRDALKQLLRRRKEAESKSKLQ